MTKKKQMGYSASVMILILTSLFLGDVVPGSMARGGVAMTGSKRPVAGLKLEEAAESSSVDCWESLMELQACTGEVILFFLNGETYLGPTCCEAIRTIGQHCWPPMFGSLGFTTQETDVLQGYCIQEATSDSPPPPPSPPSL